MTHVMVAIKIPSPLDVIRPSKHAKCTRILSLSTANSSSRLRVPVGSTRSDSMNDVKQSESDTS